MKPKLVNSRLCFSSWYKAGIVQPSIWAPKRESKIVKVNKKKNEKKKTSKTICLTYLLFENIKGDAVNLPLYEYIPCKTLRNLWAEGVENGQ